MIAYKKEWLEHNDVVAQLENAFAENCITNGEKQNAAALYPTGFYTPNIFIRIGLIILSIIIIGFSFGIFALLFLFSANEIDTKAAVLCIFFGIICYAALEWFVGTKKHYQSGVDDALQWMATGFIFAGLNLALDIGPLTNSILIFTMATFCTLRFADRLMAVIAAVALLAIIFFSLERMGNTGKNILPFVFMIISALIYFFSKKTGKVPAAKYYQKCLSLIGITGLLGVYFSGNYYVVREASIAFFNLPSRPGDSIPFGWLFWLFTIAIPFLYIFWGILKKDVILLRIGLLLLAAIVFTVRYYHQVLPVETLMIIGGLLMMAIAYLLINYLKYPKAGFTSEEKLSHPSSLNIEALIIAETLPGQPETKAGTQFGGGNFGGGGASGEY